MVSTILAMIQICVEGLRYQKLSKIGEVRFLMRGLAISPPRFSKYCEIAIPPEFSEKNIGGRSWSGAPSAVFLGIDLANFYTCASD
jgi:hypothetical protein